jgi:hypothetical protein
LDRLRSAYETGDIDADNAWDFRKHRRCRPSRQTTFPLVLPSTSHPVDGRYGILVGCEESRLNCAGNLFKAVPHYPEK